MACEEEFSPRKKICIHDFSFDNNESLVIAESALSNNVDTVTNTYTIEPPQNYRLRFPTFREPLLIGQFSVDHDRKFCNDDRQKKYLVVSPPISRLHMDLNLGYDKVIKKYWDKVERIDFLLKWILLNRTKFNVEEAGIPGDKSLHTDFICFRGLLTEILCTPYEKQDDWLICATKFKGTIYLCAYDTDRKKERKTNETPREKLMSSWGYKFEQYMTTAEEGGQPDIHSPVNENEEFCILLRTHLNTHSLVYGAEVDGLDTSFLRSHPNSQKSLKQFVELKTSREITTERQDLNFCRFKLLKWWAQSFLIGIPKITCGFRDDHGIVHTLRTLYLREIPKMAEGLWSASSCMNFCDKFLSFIKTCVTKDNPYIVYKFYWTPGKPVVCTELAKPMEFQILPDWYIAEF